MTKIAFAGTDGRTLLCAWVVSTAISDHHKNTFQGCVVRGTPAMPEFCKQHQWPVDFITTRSNSVDHYSEAILHALQDGKIDYVIPMPEALLFEGLVDRISAAGFGDRVLGLTSEAAFIEGDKIRCKELCRDAGIPVAQAWTQVDAKDYDGVLKTVLHYLADFGGAV